PGAFGGGRRRAAAGPFDQVGEGAEGHHCLALLAEVELRGARSREQRQTEAHAGEQGDGEADQKTPAVPAVGGAGDNGHGLISAASRSGPALPSAPDRAPPWASPPS